MKSLVLALVVALGSNDASFALSSRSPETEAAAVSDQKAENIKAQVRRRGIGPTSRVRVQLHTKQEVKGYISAVENTSFQVTNSKSGDVTTLTYDEVEKVRGPGLPTVAKVAIVAGAVAGALIITAALVVASWHGN